MKTVNEILERLDSCIAQCEYELHSKREEKGGNYEILRKWIYL